MDVTTILKAIFANELCGSNNCPDCREMFKLDKDRYECPNDQCDFRTKREFIEKVIPYLNGATSDLGTLEDVNVEELLSLFHKV